MPKRSVFVLSLFLVASSAVAGAATLAPPPAGTLYHGVFPGGTTGEEDDITPAEVDAYESAVGASAAWVYFSDNWYVDRAFPLETATWIRSRGAVPFIRLMLRSRPFRPSQKKPLRLKDILAGALDEDLRAWARAARDFGTPLLVEYGTEVNGQWFAWNARFNGKKQLRYGDPTRMDGAERFRDVFRRIVTLSREEGASNVSWVFHVNWDDDPVQPWNALEEYHPGDDVVDWLAVSAYGPQSPLDETYDEFADEMDAVYPRISAVAPGKPILVAEFGASDGSPLVTPQAWATAALEELLTRRWPNVAGFSWWNENWQNDNNAAHDTHMRVQDNPALEAAFDAAFGAHTAALRTTPVFTP